MKRNTLIIIVLSILLVVACFFLYKIYKEGELKEQIITQNLRSNDSLKVLNKNWTQKYASVEDLNTKKDSLLKDKDETILVLNKTVVDLREIESSGDGEFIPDTVETDNEIETGYYSFTKSNLFYTYSLNVFTAPQIYHELTMRFNPFPLTIYLTRGKDGLWSGYTHVDEAYSKYVFVSDLKVVVDRDEYTRIEKKKTRIDVGLGGGLLVTPEVYLSIGANAMFNNTHDIGYSYVLGKAWHIADYRYYFNAK